MSTVETIFRALWPALCLRMYIGVGTVMVVESEGFQSGGYKEGLTCLNLFKVRTIVCPNFGQPALTLSFTKYKFAGENSFATIVSAFEWWFIIFLACRLQHLQNLAWRTIFWYRLIQLGPVHCFSAVRTSSSRQTAIFMLSFYNEVYQ